MELNTKNNGQANAKVIAAVIAAIAIVAFLFYIAQQNGTASTGLATAVNGGENNGTIKIGLMTPLSGDAAPWGEQVKKGAEIAIEEINNERVNGKRIEVVFEDDRCDAKTGVSIATKMIGVDNIRLSTGTVCSSVMLATAPIFEKNKAVHLSTGATSPLITNAGDYIFRLWPSDDFEGKEIARFAATKLGFRSAAILYINNDYGVGLRNVFSAEFEGRGGKITAAEAFEVNSNDFRTQLGKIKESAPDAIFFVSNPAEAPLILKQMKELGINMAILGNGPSMTATNTLETAGDSAEGVFFAEPKREKKDKFEAAYLKKFGSEADYLAGLGYDSVTILFNAIKSCNGDDTEYVKNYLYSIKDYKGASAVITIDGNGDVALPFQIDKIESGKIVVVQ